MQIYTQDGETFKEGMDYIAQGNDYSAANGVKSVDKTVVSNDPEDQWVTYTIKFWNENGFEAGEINLTDHLDEYVDFLYADDNEWFAVDPGGSDPHAVHISFRRECGYEEYFREQKHLYNRWVREDRKIGQSVR